MNTDGVLNRQFLADIGVRLDEQTYQALAGHYEQTLNNRVLEEITLELDEQQLKQLEALKDATSGELTDWLAANVPQLGEIIEDEIAILMGEIAEKSDQIAS